MKIIKISKLIIYLKVNIIYEQYITLVDFQGPRRHLRAVWDLFGSGHTQSLRTGNPGRLTPHPPPQKKTT